jgi:hypothetical protein
LVKKDERILRTKPEDEEFHRSRIMFVIIGGEVKVGPKGTKDSHLEWFRKEDWVTEENQNEFLEKHIRGFYFPSENCLYCYNGWGFFFDAGVANEIAARIIKLKEAFNLNDETRICLGPKDNPVHGYNYPQYCLGKLKDLLLKPS